MWKIFYAGGLFKNIDISNGALTLLIALTTKSGIDSISQVYQNIKYNNSYYRSKKAVIPTEVGKQGQTNGSLLPIDSLSVVRCLPKRSEGISRNGKTTRDYRLRGNDSCADGNNNNNNLGD